LTVLLSIGEFKFVVKKNSFNTLSVDSRFRWTPIDKIMGPPTQQFGGKEPEKISIRGEVYTDLSGADPFKIIKEYGYLGEPKILVLESGESLGKWIIEGISESRESFKKDGTYRKSEFTLDLTKYTEPPRG
jgi:phage protein U